MFRTRSRRSLILYQKRNKMRKKYLIDDDDDDDNDSDNDDKNKHRDYQNTRATEDHFL